MLDSNIINTNKAIRSFFDGFVKEVVKITSDTKQEPPRLSTLQLFLDITIRALEAEWAGVISRDINQWVVLATTKKWPKNFPDPILIHPIEYIYNDGEPESLGIDDINTNDTLSKFLRNSAIHSIAIIPIICPVAHYEKLILLIGNKRDRIVKGDEGLPYYVTNILKYLAAFFSSVIVSLMNRQEAWQSALYDGSRKAIYERSRDLLQACGTGLDGKALDRARAALVDASTLLKILPHPRPTFKERDGPEIKNHHDEGPLTKLSCLRRKIWQKFNSPETLEPGMDEALITIAEAWQKLSRDSLSASVPPAPKLSDNVLSPKMTEKLWALAHRREYLIECLRTQLYLLHYRAAALEGVADNNEIAECDKIFYRDLYGCLRLSNYLLILVGEFLDVWAKESEEGNLLITSEWLIVWFAKKILQDRKWLHTLKEVYTPNGRAEFYYRFSAYFLYVLFLIRYFGEPNLFRFSDITEGYERFVDASLYLLAEYAHRVEQLPLNIPLYQILTGHIWANEAILYTIQDNYRDHHHHVWNVCLLGMVLLEAGLVTRLDPDWEKDANLARQRRRNWLLAGLLHDIGYGLNLNRHMLGHLNFLQGSPCLTQFLKGLNDYHDRSARELSVELDKWINFGKLQGTLDHGVVSALYLLFLDRAPQRPEEPVLPAQAWLKDIPEAFVATGKHNLDGVTISPKDDPLALLLLLCDHLQEWDRPHIDAMHLRRSMSASLHRPGQTVTLGKTVLRCLKANLSWQSDRVHLSCNQPVQIKLYYKDAGQERFQPAVIWCQNTYEFQRINFAEWPADLEIDLEVIHPVSQELSRGLRLWEMDLFEDFARKDQECLGLWAWFKAARAGTPGFSYQKVESPALPQETFKWVLKHGGFDLSRPPTTSEASRIIEAFPPGLYLRYTLWKEQRLREIRLRKR
ncbi:MAG: hypothetical protein FJ128_09680 [Deltaproteobacteria bacterium]|nr:hypothetical protein [Deltaproteobacteria bacterium]